MIKSIKARLVILSLCAPMLFVSVASADSRHEQDKIYGKSYSEWATAWLEWSLSIPVAINPLYDSTGANAAVGQTGKVWFLAGAVVTETGSNSNTASAVRKITLPKGTALFFPIMNSFWVNFPEYGDAPWSSDAESFARSYIKNIQDNATGMQLTIDGRAVPNMDKYRVNSTVGLCNLPPNPSDNVYGIALTQGPYYCVSDGVYVLLPALSPGRHVIQFKGSNASWNPIFTLNVTYNITVSDKGRGHKSDEN